MKKTLTLIIYLLITCSVNAQHWQAYDSNGVNVGFELLFFESPTPDVDSVLISKDGNSVYLGTGYITYNGVDSLCYLEMDGNPFCGDTVIGNYVRSFWNDTVFIFENWTDFGCDTIDTILTNYFWCLDGVSFPQAVVDSLDDQINGISDLTKNSLLVYPNPSSGIFNFEYSRYKVYDLSGRIFKQGEASTVNPPAGS